MSANIANPNAELVLAKAKAYVDAKYVEGKNNDTIFGKWYGLNYNPWCAMFVSKCFDEAGAIKLVAASSRKGFASCNAGWKWFVKNKRNVTVGQAQPGDIVFFNFDDNPHTTEHVGIVVSNDGKNLITYEGNTSPEKSNGSQANGGGAYKRKRSYGLVMGVVRPDWNKLNKKK